LRPTAQTLVYTLAPLMKDADRCCINAHLENNDDDVVRESI
jgi:hypothetical protein